MSKFWMVLRKDGNTTASVRHPTFLDASKEAARLAEKNRCSFYVLEAIGIVGPMEVPVIYQELPNKPAEF